MTITSVHNIYFIGIGGIGMSALAKYFLDNGANVAGYDLNHSPITDELSKLGVDIIFEDVKEKLPDNIDLVIYTPAVKDELEIIQELKRREIRFLKRAEVLGMISENIPTIAIAGTHGKTTVASMLVHIMKTAGMNIGGFVGGITKNYSSNYIGSNNPEWLVIEADEFDRSFLKLSPFYSIITSMDADHLDIYKNQNTLTDAFYQFMHKIDGNGNLILKEGLQIPDDLKTPVITYNIGEETSDIFAKNIKKSGLVNYYGVGGNINIDKIQLKVPGLHNVENSLAAIAVSDLLGINSKTIVNALNTYEGVQRRFDIKFYSNDIVYIDDYAHHPEELKAFISSVRNLLPGKKITGIFQPHLYSRTRDFADEFAKSLQLLDELLLLDIYPAREKPIKGVSSNLLLEKTALKDKCLIDKEKMVDFLKSKNIEVLLTMGAGDIGRLAEPITEMLKQKNKNYNNV